MSVKTVKTVAAIILIWTACAPVTYIALKRDWVRPRHNTFNFQKMEQRTWTVGIRSAVLPICALGPVGLSIAIGATISEALPESDPNVRAEW